MSWDAVGAIGELLGSVGVLITLLYLALQVRKTQDAIELSRFDATRANMLAIGIHEFDCAELLLNANNQVEMTELETKKFQTFVRNQCNNHFLSYLQAERTGRPPEQAVRNMAAWLFYNPGALTYWKEWRFHLDKQRTGVPGNRGSIGFDEAVAKDIEIMGKEYGEPDA